jgi:hypothetical protein
MYVTVGTCLGRLSAGGQQSNKTYNTYQFHIHTSLVIRDLTLRVFAITRFRGGGGREKSVQ